MIGSSMLIQKVYYKIMKIITYPNEILRKKAQEIDNFSDIQKIIPEFKKTMLEHDGIGLAAPQIGKSIKMIAIQTKEGPKIFINPKIISKSFKKEIAEEGCLSLPKIFGKVKRAYKVAVKFQNEKGIHYKITVKGLYARVLQHEIDHLDGILFIDKIIK